MVIHPAADSPQQGIQSIEVGAQVLRALEAGRGLMALARLMVQGLGGQADGLADALRATAGQISAELGYRPA